MNKSPNQTRTTKTYNKGAKVGTALGRNGLATQGNNERFGTVAGEGKGWTLTEGMWGGRRGGGRKRRGTEEGEG